MTTMVELTVFKEVPLYEYRTTLSNREYVLRFDYSGREDRWFLYVLNAAAALIAGPLKIVCGKDLLSKVRWNPDAPAGAIVALDLKGTADSPGAAPTWSEFGRRVRLFYQEAT